jgi:uncharacterized protein (TIGR01244 family)
MRYSHRMADIRIVTPDFATAPQMTPEDMTEAAARGFKRVINNRPDGEAPGQPTSAEMEAAARAAGLDYVAAPFTMPPGADHVRQVGEAVRSAPGPVLAFCRSGTRSITAWALSQADAGRDREELVRLGREAGYDLSGALEV